MRALQILAGELGDKLDFLHAKTHAAFWRGVEGVLSADQLWLTALGRGMPGSSTAKHRIKAADRLLGSAKLRRHFLAISRVLTHHLLAGLERPCISVDWTGVGPHHHALTASLAFRGRSLPLFTRIFPDTSKGSPKAQREFLQQLAQVVPTSCTPILITDAGFHLDWLEQVRDLEWDFVGRVRGTMHVRVKNAWMPLVAIHRMARTSSLDLGVVSMCKKRPQDYRVVVSSRRKSKGRKRLTSNGTPRQDTNAKCASKAAREPWVLATSLQCSPNKVVARYALRMQIEECFRDLKAHRHGWAPRLRTQQFTAACGNPRAACGIRARRHAHPRSRGRASKASPRLSSQHRPQPSSAVDILPGAPTHPRPTCLVVETGPDQKRWWQTSRRRFAAPLRQHRNAGIPQSQGELIPPPSGCNAGQGHQGLGNHRAMTSSSSRRVLPRASASSDSTLSSVR